MKILSLTFANINSLAGDWRINFSDPAFADGLFALTGPTGSGKTSVLDAISLSLFGRTVRQDSISKETNEVMTRGAGSAYAETEFETGDKCYLARWEQHRAREKPSGALQTAKRSLASLPEGTTLHEGLRGMDDAVRDVLGLSFEQFTRSALLAQGQFDAFLKADDKDRSAILEQATGTEIYSRLGAKVFERFQQERDKTRELELSRQAVQTLPDDERVALDTALAQKNAEKVALDTTVKNLTAQNVWLNNLAVLRQQYSALQKEHAQLDTDTSAAQPDLERLTRAEVARALDVGYAELKHLRILVAQSREAVTGREEALGKLTIELSALTPKIAVAQTATTDAQTALDTGLPVLQKIRILLGDIRTATVALVAAKKAEDDTRKSLTVTQSQLDAATQSVTQDRSVLEAADHVHAGHPVSPAAEASPLIRALREGLAIEARQATSAPALENARKKRDAALAAKEAAERERDTHRPDLITAQAAARDAALLAKTLADLNEQRAELEDGKPCPLCGATDHPFASGNLPSPSKTKKQLTDIEEKIAALDTQTDTARKESDKAEKTFRAKELGFQTLKDVCAAARQTVAEKKSAVSTRLDETVTRMVELEQQKAKQAETLSAQTHERTMREQEVQTLKTDRIARFPGDPDAEEKRLRGILASAQESHQTLLQKQASLTADLKTARSELAAALSKRDASAVSERIATTTFAEAWSSAGFADEPTWLAARLTQADLTAFGARKKELADRAANLKGRAQQNAESLQTEEAKALTDQPQDKVATDFTAANSALGECQTALGELKQRLATDEENRQRKAAQGDVLERQKIMATKWGNLNTWVGGADGSQFKRYAQGITLRRLLALATPHVARMTRGRYEMVWDSASRALLPDIIDRDQGDARRAVSNLSGGETFILSLALALGLSAMSSERLRVDTLFLDEGFGTLDDEALATALDTLTALKQEGKLIGVVSHVQAIKDQLASQIRIHPQPGGHSHLSGPGVERLSDAGHSTSRSSSTSH